jgi:hypothetical protein
MAVKAVLDLGRLIGQLKKNPAYALLPSLFVFAIDNQNLATPEIE